MSRTRLCASRTIELIASISKSRSALNAGFQSRRNEEPRRNGAAERNDERSTWKPPRKLTFHCVSAVRIAQQRIQWIGFALRRASMEKKTPKSGRKGDSWSFCQQVSSRRDFGEEIDSFDTLNCWCFQRNSLAHSTQKWENEPPKWYPMQANTCWESTERCGERENTSKSTAMIPDWAKKRKESSIQKLAMIWNICRNVWINR